MRLSASSRRLTRLDRNQHKTATEVMISVDLPINDIQATPGSIPLPLVPVYLHMRFISVRSRAALTALRSRLLRLMAAAVLHPAHRPAHGHSAWRRARVLARPHGPRILSDLCNPSSSVSSDASRSPEPTRKVIPNGFDDWQSACDVRFWRGSGAPLTLLKSLSSKTAAHGSDILALPPWRIVCSSGGKQHLFLLVRVGYHVRERAHMLEGVAQ